MAGAEHIRAFRMSGQREAPKRICLDSCERRGGYWSCHDPIDSRPIVGAPISRGSKPERSYAIRLEC